MVELDFSAIEAKWQKRWEEEKAFEVEVDSKKEKYFVSFPYPYVNAYPHIGHLYTIMRVEAMARYKRLRGYNVLFAQGWHATGSPIVNAANRILDGEPKQIQIMKDMGITGSELKKFTDPVYWIEFFAPRCKRDYSSMGLSVDWRREFFTTSLNPHYDKFVTWQFNTLKKKGYIIQGEFPVVWDPKDECAVGDHGRSEGEGVTPQDFIWLKYPLQNSDLVLMAGTTRPDAVYGQSNLWLDPNGNYVVVQVKNEKWVVGRDVVYKILNQFDSEAKVLEDIDPKELIGKYVSTPLLDQTLIILPAEFIDSAMGSGIVYSALEDPVDLYELEKIQSSDEIISSFHLDRDYVMKLGPVDIISVEGMGTNLGKVIGEEFGVTGADDEKNLALAKAELNKRVFRKGIMMKNCGECAGMSVPECQAFLKNKLTQDGDAVMFYELPEKVVSRSLTECIVKVVDDQWFLNYSDAEWKKKVHNCLDQLELFPDKVRAQFNHVIDWLHEWACVRKEGLGTKLPWDKQWLIESLSDSTIYMAYYTISHLITEFEPDELTDAFFDYVFLGKGKGNAKMKQLRDSFTYWYPMDFRNSGKDLIQNHLTFFMFHHVAIWDDPQYWPKGIGCNGWVTVDGQKMSKSLGNMIPLREMGEKFGVDASRLTILNGKEGLDDPNWDSTFALSLSTKFRGLYEFITTHYENGRDDFTATDKEFENKSHILLKEIEPLMNTTMFRSAIQKSFFSYLKMMREYHSDCGGDVNRELFMEFCHNFIIMLNPFCPHLSEELWESIGKKGLASHATWPVVDASKILTEGSEQDITEKTITRVQDIFEKVGKKETVYLYVLPFEVEKVDAEAISAAVGCVVNVHSVTEKEKYDPEHKAKGAKPGMPGIYVE